MMGRFSMAAVLLLVVSLLSCSESAAINDPAHCARSCRCYQQEDQFAANCSSLSGISNISTRLEVLRLTRFDDHLSVKPGAFSQVPNLRELHLDHLSLVKIYPGAFKGLDNLEVLDLADNSLSVGTQIAKAVRDLPNLRRLVLRGNNFGGEHAQIPILASRSLKFLDLGRCKLRNLPPQVFTNLHHLRHIVLSGNFIRRFNASAFPPSVVSIDLSNNDIELISKSELMKLEKVDTVELAGNPIHCNCELLKVSFDYNMEKAVVCAYPKQLMGKNLVDLNKHQLCGGKGSNGKKQKRQAENEIEGDEEEEEEEEALPNNADSEIPDADDLDEASERNPKNEGDDDDNTDETVDHKNNEHVNDYIEAAEDQISEIQDPHHHIPHGHELEILETHREHGHHESDSPIYAPIPGKHVDKDGFTPETDDAENPDTLPDEFDTEGAEPDEIDGIDFLKNDRKTEDENARSPEGHVEYEEFRSKQDTEKKEDIAENANENQYRNTGDADSEEEVEDFSEYENQDSWPLRNVNSEPKVTPRDESEKGISAEDVTEPPIVSQDDVDYEDAEVPVENKDSKPEAGSSLKSNQDASEGENLSAGTSDPEKESSNEHPDPNEKEAVHDDLENKEDKDEHDRIHDQIHDEHDDVETVHGNENIVRTSDVGARAHGNQNSSLSLDLSEYEKDVEGSGEDIDVVNNINTLNTDSGMEDLRDPQEEKDLVENDVMLEEDLGTKDANNNYGEKLDNPVDEKAPPSEGDRTLTDDELISIEDENNGENDKGRFNEINVEDDHDFLENVEDEEDVFDSTVNKEGGKIVDLEDKNTMVDNEDTEYEDKENKSHIESQFQYGKHDDNEDVDLDKENKDSERKMDNGDNEADSGKDKSHENEKEGVHESDDTDNEKEYDDEDNKEQQKTDNVQNPQNASLPTDESYDDDDSIIPGHNIPHTNDQSENPEDKEDADENDDFGEEKDIEESPLNTWTGADEKPAESEEKDYVDPVDGYEENHVGGSRIMSQPEDVHKEGSGVESPDDDSDTATEGKDGVIDEYPENSKEDVQTAFPQYGDYSDEDADESKPHEKYVDVDHHTFDKVSVNATEEEKEEEEEEEEASGAKVFTGLRDDDGVDEEANSNETESGSGWPLPDISRKHNPYLTRDDDDVYEGSAFIPVADKIIPKKEETSSEVGIVEDSESEPPIESPKEYDYDTDGDTASTPRPVEEPIIPFRNVPQFAAPPLNEDETRTREDVEEDEGTEVPATESVVVDKDLGGGKELAPIAASAPSGTILQSPAEDVAEGNNAQEDSPSNNAGSYVVLGVIMAIIVLLLGYAVVRSRRQKAATNKEKDAENPGRELQDVSKPLINNHHAPEKQPLDETREPLMTPKEKEASLTIDPTEATQKPQIADEKDSDKRKSRSEPNGDVPEVLVEPTAAPQQLATTPKEEREAPPPSPQGHSNGSAVPVANGGPPSPPPSPVTPPPQTQSQSSPSQPQPISPGAVRVVAKELPDSVAKRPVIIVNRGADQQQV